MKLILLLIFTSFSLYSFSQKDDNKNDAISNYILSGDRFSESGKYSDAVNSYQNALRLSMDIDSRRKVKKSLNKLADTYELLKDKKKSEIHRDLTSSSFDIIKIVVFGENTSQTDNSKTIKFDLTDLQKIIAKIVGENKELKDSIMFQITNIATLQYVVTSLNDSLKTKQLILDEINDELDTKKSELTRVEAYLQNRNIALAFSFLIIIIIGVLAVISYRGYTIERKQHLLLAVQEKEIRQKNEEITRKNEQITGSVRYAERIQKALFPPNEIIKNIFPESFIFFKPRDIVSGDFYWISKTANKTVVAAVDCTGHGIPGAFMSVLGIKLLEEIVSKTGIQAANEILNQLRVNVIKSFHQHEMSKQTKDGMDIALVVIDKENMTLEYSGAYNPLILIREGKQTIYKADRQPVGFHEKYTAPFTNNIIRIQKDDRIYLSSDGYIDQFGGANGKKFMINTFSQMLAESSYFPMTEQLNIIEKTFDEWKGPLDQLDDVLVFGIKI